jgi:hypothetical protein
MKQAEVPADFNGASDAALLEADRRWSIGSVERSRKAFESVDARLVALGLHIDGSPCPFAHAAATMSRTPLTVGQLRAWSNHRRADLDLPLLPEPEVATA